MVQYRNYQCRFRFEVDVVGVVLSGAGHEVGSISEPTNHRRKISARIRSMELPKGTDACCDARGMTACCRRLRVLVYWLISPGLPVLKAYVARQSREHVAPAGPSGSSSAR